jgi:predicted AAA+ superfamily ATPase
MLRGARQVGKTWSVIDFGRQYFEGIVHVVDLEKHPDWHGIFDGNLEPSRICSELEIILNASIVPGRDLLFFDEIQSCPKAVMALRYFFEEMPQLHVIAAGSLLEFTMRDVPFPVGRIQMLSMNPMGFIEFLKATGKSKAAEELLDAPKRLPDAVHEALLDDVRRYLFVGGMPECVRRYSETGRMRDAFEVQSDLVNSFRQDFSKYAPLADKRCLNAVLSTVAQNVGRQIKYARMADGFSNPTIKKAFELLLLARVVRKVSSVNPPVIPFGASVSEKRFKALMVDTGLMQHLCNLPVDTEFRKPDLLSIYEGAMAEQFVGQEFLAASQTDLYYWSRKAKSSTAEVDFILAREGRVLPVEVKSGSSGRLKSLHLFLKEHEDCPRGYVLSCAPYAELTDQKLAFLPLYFAHTLALIKDGILKNGK